MIGKLDIGSKQFAVIAMCLFGAFSITPFAFIRLLEKNYAVALLDIFLIIICVVTALCVNTAKRADIGAKVMCVIASLSLSYVVNVNGPDMVFWLFPVMIAMFFIAKPLNILVINSLVILSISPALYLGTDIIKFMTILTTIIGANLFAFVYANMNHFQKKKMYDLAWFDSLTGVNNRRSLDKTFSEIGDKNETVSIITMDIDNFKLINDTFGHTVGDNVLIEMINAIKPNIRDTDQIFRYGGEEFVVVALKTDIENAQKIAEKLRVIVEEHHFSEDLKVTISLGISELKKGENPQKCFERSDKALYESKRTGKNRYSIA